MNVIIYSLGLSFLVVNSLALYITFLWAYFSNDFVFSANINMFGEANIEFIILPMTIAIGVYASYSLLKTMIKKSQLSA